LKDIKNMDCNFFTMLKCNNERERKEDNTNFCFVPLPKHGKTCKVLIRRKLIYIAFEI